MEERLPFLFSSLTFQLVTAVGAAVADEIIDIRNAEALAVNQVINPSAYPIATSLVPPERRATAVAVRRC